MMPPTRSRPPKALAVLLLATLDVPMLAALAARSLATLDSRMLAALVARSLATLAVRMLATLAVVAGAGACSQPPTQETQTEDKVPVVTRPATRGTIRPLIVATGMVKPATGAELLVSAPQSARIAEMPKGVGDRVRKGDLLVRFDIPSLDADASERR
ncbi:MAG TPA: hypothetical protein VHG32_06860, partial [Thermoanaerobaculia bacterium]|nr:hypothetical protein [Thermoanaerobaculia bacterium]